MAVAHGEGTALPCAQPRSQLHSSTLSLPPLPQDDFVELFAHHPWGLGLPYLASTSGYLIGQRQVKTEVGCLHPGGPFALHRYRTGHSNWQELLGLASPLNRGATTPSKDSKGFTK